MRRPYLTKINRIGSFCGIGSLESVVIYVALSLFREPKWLFSYPVCTEDALCEKLTRK